MLHYTLKKSLLISFILFVSALFGENIDVCLWRGSNPESIIGKFRNKYKKGEIYTLKHNGQYLIINNVAIEDYLTGVLAREMDYLWPLEALKAQAVASRTLVIYTAALNETKKLPYDIENSIFYQVYGATNCKKIKEAVESTAGEILSYNGRIVQVFFHANCGGKTLLSSDVWGGVYPHISSVVDPYCKDTPYYRWEKVFPEDYLSKILGLSAIEKIEIERTEDSSRVDNLKFFLKNGTIKSFKGHEFRMKVNNKKSAIQFDTPDIIPSTNFNIRKTGSSFIFSGTGYGHGVGMCQWGARRMAETGFNYRQILKHYFPEMEIRQR
jgi:stage II sporulation protein D